MEKSMLSVTIKPVNMVHVEFPIVGTAPYVQHKFGQKAQEAMIATQKEGGPAKSKKVRTPKDFEAVYLAATHFSSEGWPGIPAPSFRNAMISACRTVGYQMTRAKLAIFIEADGFDVDDGTPLVKIVGEPRPHIAPARNDNGKMDIRCRPMWREGWSAIVRAKFDADMFTASDVFNLLRRAGAQVGIGEGRPDSRNSAGLGWGTFDVVAGKAEESQKAVKRA